jgi:acetyl esterase/lipase
MNTVDVDYRLASQSLAPAAIEDARCALHWVYDHAGEYGFDRSKIVVSGDSAGGHLALMTGMLTPSDGFDNGCDRLIDDWAMFQFKMSKWLRSSTSLAPQIFRNCLKIPPPETLPFDGSEMSPIE